MVTFKASLAKAKENIEYRNRCMNGICDCGTVQTTAAVASMALGVIFSAMASSKSYTTGTETKTTTTTETDDVITHGTLAGKEDPTDSKQKEIVRIMKEECKKTNFSASNPFIGDLTKKYDLYKTFGWDDKKISERLGLYYDALVSKHAQVIYAQALDEETQKYMTEHNITDITNMSVQEYEAMNKAVYEACRARLEKDGIVDVDDSILKAVVNKKKLGLATTPEYFGAIKDRGQGYVELYDTNGDDVVSFEEFNAGETRDYRAVTGDNNATADDITTQIFFNMMDADGNGSLDAKEMSTHLFSISRLNDDATMNTVADISFMEWAYSQDIFTKETLDKLADPAQAAALKTEAMEIIKRAKAEIQQQVKEGKLEENVTALANQSIFKVAMTAQILKTDAMLYNSDDYNNLFPQQ